MRIINQQQVKPSEDEVHARVKFLSLLQWTQANRYSYSAMEWRMTQSVFDAVFQRDWDTYFLIGFAFAVPWREKARGRVRQMVWPTLCGLWAAEFGTTNWDTRNSRRFSSQVFWDSVVFLDSPLGAASRKIEEVYNFSRGGPPLLADWIHHHDVFTPTLEILQQQYPAPSGSSILIGGNSDNIGASGGKSMLSSSSTPANSNPHLRRRESALEKLVSIALLRSTLASLFAGSALNEPLSSRSEVTNHGGKMLQPPAVTGSAAAANYTKGGTYTDSAAPINKAGSVYAQYGETIEVVNLCLSNRFWHWNPICITKTPLGPKTEGKKKKSAAKKDDKEEDGEEEVVLTTEYQFMANSLSLVIPATVGSTIPFASTVVGNSRHLSRMWYQTHMQIYSVWHLGLDQPTTQPRGGGSTPPPGPSSSSL